MHKGQLFGRQFQTTLGIFLKQSATLTTLPMAQGPNTSEHKVLEILWSVTKVIVLSLNILTHPSHTSQINNNDDNKK